MGRPVELLMYVKSGCCLCDEMAAVVRRVAARTDLTLSTVDITDDNTLQGEYGERVPVLLYHDEVLAKYRTTEQDLLRMIEAIRSGERTGQVDDA